MPALNYVIRYISQTKSAALLFPIKSKADLTASSNSSSGNTTSSKGKSGCLFLINNSLVVWWSIKQILSAQSTCEAEYSALKKTSHCRAMATTAM